MRLVKIPPPIQVDAKAVEPPFRRVHGKSWSRYLLKLVQGQYVYFENHTESDLNGIRCAISYVQRSREGMKFSTHRLNDKTFQVKRRY